MSFTLIALLALMNAINLVDAADGLAGGLSRAALLFLAISALLVGHPVSALLWCATITAVLTFLSMNMRFQWQVPAKLLLCDSGSMMLGMLMTQFSIQVARGGSGILPMVAVWFLALPLINIGVVILRRLANGHSRIRARRDHIHHMLITAGMGLGTAVVSFYRLY